MKRLSTVIAYHRLPLQLTVQIVVDTKLTPVMQCHVHRLKWPELCANFDPLKDTQDSRVTLQVEKVV